MLRTTPALARREALLRGCVGAFEEVRLTLSGACLSPHGQPGDRVWLVSSARRAPRFGDLVLAFTPAGLRLHRRVWPPWPSRRRPSRTMADRAWSLDPGPGDVLAVAVGLERAGRIHSPRRRATGVLCLLRALASKLRRLGPRAPAADPAPVGT